MNELTLNILTFVEKKVKVNIIDLQEYFKYDYTMYKVTKILEVLTGKKYLTESSDYDYEITETGKILLTETEYQKKVKDNITLIRENTEIENLRLQNNELKYRDSIRDKENEIYKLTIENLKLQNIGMQSNRKFFIIGLVCGFIGSNLQWIIMLLLKYLQ